MLKRFGRTRSRKIPGPLGQNTITGRFFIETAPNNGDYVLFQERKDFSVPYMSVASCTDEVHDWPRQHVGGPFRKIQIDYSSPYGMQGSGTYITPSSYYTISSVGSGHVKYVGGFCPPLYWPGATEDVLNLSVALGADSPLVPSTSTLEDSVWDRTKPKIEQGGLFVAIAEVRDARHMMMTPLRSFMDIYHKLGGKASAKIISGKKLSDHFLNYNFGWIPFVSDLTKFCDNITKVDSRIQKIMSDNGNWTKRKVFLVNNTATVELGTDTGILTPPGGTMYINGLFDADPTYSCTEEKTSIAMGVGRFRYYIPYFDSSSILSGGSMGPLRRQIALHGARATPVNIYKAIPWTWLIDWVSSVGQTFQAVQDASLDGMAAKYLYLTHHQTKLQRFKQVLPLGAANGGKRVLTFTRLIDIKQRKEADAPFGFGLTWDKLSPKQLAILAALGISKH